MLTEKMKTTLCERLNSIVIKGNDGINVESLKRMIETFDHSLEIEPVKDVEMVSTHIYNAIERFLDSGMERAPECVKDLNLIEQYAKHIMFLARPKLLNTIPERKWDPLNRNSSKEWELKDTYIEGLGLMDEKIQLKKEGNALIEALEKNPIMQVPSPNGYYLIAYSARNEESHNAIKRDVYVANKVVLCVIMAYILIADKYAGAIERVYGYLQVRRSMDVDNYLKKVLTEKQSKLERYVPLAWIEYPKEKDNKMLLPDKIGQLSRKQLKIVGDAGTGKTFFMEKIECLLAQSYFGSEKKAYIIPVYVKLIELSKQGNSSIKSIFADKTGARANDAEELLCNRSILLLLDGYDEISDKTLKREIAVEIETLVSRGANIIVSDRDLNQLIPLSKDLNCYTPQKMEQKNYRDMISKYSQNEDVKQELLNKVDSSPDFFNADYNTPLKLVNLIEICDFNGSVIEDNCNIKNAYIQFLFDREAHQKKNPLTKPLQRLLAGLALEGEGPFTEAKVLSVFSNWKNKLGFECDTDACLTLAIQLGIIEKKENDLHIEYGFYEEFYIPFLDFADKFGMIDLEDQ